MTNKKVENLRTAWEGLASENVKFYIRTTSKAEMHSKGRRCAIHIFTRILPNDQR